MNEFVTDLIVDNVVTHVQGFSSIILIIFFEKLSVKCEGIWMQMQITNNGRSNRMLHVNRAWEPHINQDSHTECYTLTMHGSHMLIKIPTQNAAC